MDIQKAFRASPLLPAHKRFVPIYWQDHVYIDHVVPFGLATAGGIQGVIADAIVDILAAFDIEPTFKWVDDFIFFREPVPLGLDSDESLALWYRFDVDDIKRCTAPLGILWHDLDSKGQDFSFEVEYVGFNWDLVNKVVKLPERKRLRYLTRLLSFTSNLKAQLVPAMKLLGTLQHITFVYVLGRAYLPALTRFISKFDGNRFMYRFIDRAVLKDLTWWHEVLSHPDISCSLLPRSFVDKDIWVDASTSWGIGLWIANRWAAWHLRPGWSNQNRDIGWLETIAIEIAAMWLATQNIHDAHARIYSDNTGVIGALLKGRSRNAARNNSIKRISHLLAPFNISLDPCYVASADNKSDPISRGELGPSNMRLQIAFSLPRDLQPFLDYV